MTMKKLIDEISVIPGVTGSCIFDKSAGPLCTDSGNNLAAGVLEKVGAYLVRMLKMGKMAGLDITTSHFRLDKCTVVGMPLDSGAILLTICDTQANCSLVAATASMLASDMRDELGKENAAAAGRSGDVSTTGMETAKEQEVDPYLQSYLDQMEEALAGAIGPVAGMVIGDYITKWQRNGPAVTTRLNELADMLLAEIDEDSLIDEFTARVKKIV